MTTKRRGLAGAAVALLACGACTGTVSGSTTGPAGAAAGGAGDLQPSPPASGGAGGGAVPVTGELTDLSTGSLASQCTTPTAPPARVWRLSRDQIGRTLKAALGVDAKPGQLASFNDGTGLLFRNEAAGLVLHKADVTSWALSATDLAQAAVANLRAAKTCPDFAAAACGGALADAIGPKLFRRPLRPDEKTRYAGLYATTLAGEGGADAAIAAVVSAFLQSPYFLYRSELGKPIGGKPGLARLTGYELASALSYTLWNAPPDAELMRAAGAGELDGDAGLRKQAARLIGDAQFSGFYGVMLADLTNASHMATREGADALTELATITKTLGSELDGYVQAVLSERPTLGELLRRPRVAAPVAGLLSLGAIAFANAGTDHPSPVRRGVMVRERLLCSPVPPPPPSVKQEFASGADVVTNRQRYERTMAPADCNACHRLFNPIGYAFESFDELGRYRTQDAGHDLDLSGELVQTRDADGKFANMTELVARLAATKQTSECFALEGFRYVSGRFETPGDLCAVDRVHGAFAASGGDLKTLAVELVASDAFAFRTIDR